MIHKKIRGKQNGNKISIIGRSRRSPIQEEHFPKNTIKKTEYVKKNFHFYEVEKFIYRACYTSTTFDICSRGFVSRRALKSKVYGTACATIYYSCEGLQQYGRGAPGE